MVLIVAFFLVQALPLTLRFWTQFRSFLFQGLLFLLPNLFCSFLMLQLPVLETGVVLRADTLVDKHMGTVVVLVGTLEADKGVDIAVGTTTDLCQSLCPILCRNLYRVLCAILSQIQVLDS